MGCSMRQHRWQKLRMVVLRHHAGNVSRSLFPTAKEKFEAFIAVGGLLSARSRPLEWCIDGHSVILF